MLTLQFMQVSCLRALLSFNVDDLENYFKKARVLTWCVVLREN